MNEDGGTIQDKLNGGAVVNEECGQCRAGALTFICLAFAAAFAGMLPPAMRVSRAGGARITQAAGRNKRGLMLAINRDQWGRHFFLAGMEHGPGGAENISRETSGLPPERWCELRAQESSSVSPASSPRSQRVGSAGRIS